MREDNMSVDTVLQQPMNDATAWISHDVLASLMAEASVWAPQETGGVLLGYRGADGGLVITHGIGPGPNAVHSEDRFMPDHEYHVAELARLYEESNRELQYLGDWHSHPNGGSALSRLDRACLRRIARSAEARAEQPIMLVLAGHSEWEPCVWCYGLKRWGPATRSLTVRLFDSS